MDLNTYMPLDNALAATTTPWYISNSHLATPTQKKELGALLVKHGLELISALHRIIAKSTPIQRPPVAHANELKL